MHNTIMTNVIVTTPEELVSLIEGCLRKHLRREPVQETLPEHLSLDGAIAYLNGNGFLTSKTKIYRLTSQNKIPYMKYGKQLVFSRKLLHEWMMDNAIQVNE